MEIILRCEVADQPGSLAELAGAIGQAGGDIQAVEVVGQGRDGHVLDDLIVVADRDTLRNVVKLIEEEPRVRLVHAGPSRGHPGDAVTRLAVGLEALLTGLSEPENGTVALVGGLLRATSVQLVPASEVPEKQRKRLVLPLDHRFLVIERDYPFTDVEGERAQALARLCAAAIATRLAAAPVVPD